MARVMGIDYGTRRVGVAISDELKLIAQGLETIEYLDEPTLLKRLKTLVQSYDVERVVLGYPLSLTGSITQSAQTVAGFAARLSSEIGLPVELIDERLSSVQAQKIIRERGRTPSRNRPLIDKVSAILLLQAYLERMR